MRWSCFFYALLDEKMRGMVWSLPVPVSGRSLFCLKNRIRKGQSLEHDRNCHCLRIH